MQHVALSLSLLVVVGCVGELSSSETPPPSPGRDPSDPPRTRPDGVPIPGTDTCRPPPERVWQLSPAQLAGVLASAVPGAPQTALEDRFLRTTTAGAPFTSDPRIENASSLFVSGVFVASAELSGLLLGASTALDPCLDGAARDTAECALAAATALARRAWRRAPTDDERARLAAGYASARDAHGPEVALRAVMRQVLASPGTLYRTEIGRLDDTTGEARLTPHEVADFVSFTLTDAPSDALLRAAADDGSILDAAVAETHVRRLLSVAPAAAEVADTDGRSRPRRTGLVRFFAEWLELERIPTAPIAALLRERPEGDAIRALGEERLARWLQNEPLLLTRHVLWEGDALLGTLLAADFTAYGNTLADYYGVPRPAPEIGPTQHDRRGLLMQGGFLVGHDSASDRGRFVRERLFCQPIPEPPPDVDQNLAGVERELEAREGRALSPREVRALHLGSASCATCHRLMDPLGFPLDGFDALGVPRETWPGGSAIDTAGAIEGTPASDRAVADGRALMEHLAASADVRACFVQQLFAFVHGRSPARSDGCYLDRLTRRFEDTGGNVVELLVAMLTGEETRARTPVWDTEGGGS